jgi:tetratricopeptide (TPR) repeat protein
MRSRLVGLHYRHRVTAAALLALLALGLGLGSGACSRRAQPGSERRPKIDRSLMACLGAQRAYHRQADVHLAAGNVRAAIRSIEQILGLACTGRKNPEVQEAVLDAYGRLGRLHLKLGQLDRARERVSQGLARPGPPSFFRANLLMVRGDLLDAMATERDKAGKPAEARRLRREAIAAFERSARMNRRLLSDLVQ